MFLFRFFSDFLFRFPHWKKAKPFRVVLEPGDTLFVPSNWLHHVECIDDSISITYNFADSSNSKKVKLAYTMYLLTKALKRVE